MRMTAFAAALFTIVASNLQSAENLSYFRADRGLAANDSQPLPDTLSEGELEWRVPVAPGHSTPCVAGDLIVVTTFENDKLATVAFDRASGAERWRQSAPAAKIEEFHKTSSPAAATAASDGQRIYVFFGSYGLLCYDLSGKLLWSKPMGPFQDEFGSSSSPLLIDGKLVLNEDHDLNSFLIAINCADGKTIWQTPREGFTRSYATPIVWNVAGREQLIVAGALQVTSYAVDSGRPLWSLDGFARIVNTTPVAADDLLLVATWSPGGDKESRIAMEPWDATVKQFDKNGDQKLAREEVTNPDVLDRFFRIDLNQDQGLDQQEWERYASVFERARNVLQAIRLKQTSEGTLVPEVAWTYEKGLPYVASPLVYRGVVYLVKDGGILSTLDLQTGKLLKQGRLRGTGSYYASPVAGDGKVYLASDPGVVTILEADGHWQPGDMRELFERIVATPVISDGRIYVRSEKAMYCFVKK
ncbi:MAG: PQQ-binding-like beta-propeller repeat protein [Planctomycetes bacterium]|nr:PQQ-binding-like beta-propeller repeat protein [Planctomycetota bacterium]